KQQGDIKVVFHPDISGPKDKKAIVVLLHGIGKVEINTAQSAANSVVPIEISIQRADPLVDSGQFEGVEMPAVPPTHIKLQPIGHPNGLLVRNFGSEPITVAKAEAQGMVGNILGA